MSEELGRLDPVGDIVQVADNAPHGGVVDHVGRGGLDIAPATVGVEQPAVEADRRAHSGVESGEPFVGFRHVIGMDQVRQVGAEQADSTVIPSMENNPGLA